MTRMTTKMEISPVARFITLSPLDYQKIDTFGGEVLPHTQHDLDSLSDSNKLPISLSFEI